MTREEAIQELTHELRVWESECKSAHTMKDALRMAIEALKADAVQTELPQYEEWQDSFNKMCESARPKTFVANEWDHNTFKEED